MHVYVLVNFIAKLSKFSLNLIKLISLKFFLKKKSSGYLINFLESNLKKPLTLISDALFSNPLCLLLLRCDQFVAQFF